jgi:hypothetical protein
VAEKWWWEHEARRLAEAGDFKAAYETLRDNVAFHVIEVERDSYAEQLEREVIALEQKLEALREDNK